MTLAQTFARISQLSTEIEQNHGKRGNTTRRTELEALEAKVAKFQARRAQMKANSQSKTRSARTPSRIEDTRKTIARYAAATIARGNYGELVVRVSNEYWTDRTDSVARPNLRSNILRHPRLAHIAALRAAWARIDAAGEAHQISETEMDFDDKGRGTSTNYDLYGYNDYLSLVQVRRFERTKYTNIKLRYFVTDGETAVEIPNGKKSLIKKAASADASADSPLRMLKNVLPVECQDLVQGDAPKLSTTQPGKLTTYKIVQRDEDNKLVSLYDATTTYQVGAVMANRLGDRAGHHNIDGGQRHEGGYYSHPTIQAVLNLQAEGLLARGANDSKATYVLLECEASGRTAHFDSGKIATTYLRPKAILAEYKLADIETVKANLTQ